MVNYYGSWVIMEHKCPKCGSLDVQMVNHYYHSNLHHLNIHYKCLTCGTTWLVEEDPLD